MAWEEKPLELLQVLQSEAIAPLGRVAVEQLVQVVPMITLPLGHKHCEVALFQVYPFRQTQPKAFASPFEKVTSLQSVQKPLPKTTKF
jgi:hypothetical protein